MRGTDYPKEYVRGYVLFPYVLIAALAVVLVVVLKRKGRRGEAGERERNSQNWEMDGSESSAPQQAQVVAVHPAVEPLSYLLGTWRGQGEGGFPTINSFKYGEQLNFSHPGNKVIMFQKQSNFSNYFYRRSSKNR